MKSGYLMKMVPVLARTITTEAGCMEWQGCLNSYGYGTVRRGGKYLGTHRISWMENVGPIPDGLWVLHKCDNRKCINPDHLFLGDAADNMQDKARKGRGNPPVGERAHGSKLTADQVRAIRQQYAEGEPRKHLAAMFSVSITNIDMIVTNRNWRHIL